MLKNILLYIWQLPQNLFGAILVWLYNVESSREWNDVPVYYTPLMPSGISLGRYIILNDHYENNTWQNSINTHNHEWGHTRQSAYLGWLYLLLIGLPSLCGNIYDRIAHKDWPYTESAKWYYNQPWEKWADKLGNVEREF